MMKVDKASLFMLRCAASKWLSEHLEDANAEAVRRALIATNHAVDVSPGRSDEQMPEKAKEARARLEAAAQVIDRNLRHLTFLLKDLEQGLAGTVAGGRPFKEGHACCEEAARHREGKE